MPPASVGMLGTKRFKPKPHKKLTGYGTPTRHPKQQEEIMATAKNNLDRVLDDAREVEDFLYALLSGLDEQKLSQGDDVLGYAKKRKLKIPRSLRGEKITWETDQSGAAHRHGETLVFVRPGHVDAVGLVIKCIRIGSWRICLECGWFWCRIVISRRF
jgi:hypothetical protein